ncbi:putative tetratricopeptide-like helical domain superfamily, DYW domain-containing protein [Helianthus annuus]|nr:putative tetratricopeptide-like helical domain superfamily, DYW domain-containing protein [Helianthus annuus]
MANFRHQLSDHYVSLIQGTIVNKNPRMGKKIHAQIIKSGVHIGVILMNNLINLYAKTGFLVDARKLFDEMPERNASSWNTVISAYAKQGRIDYARQLFEQMPEPDSVSWTAMMVGYNQTGRFEKAIKMLSDMIHSKVMPTQYTFTIVLASCAAMKSLEIGRKVHSCVVKVGLSSYTSVANSLLNMYAKSGDVLTAESVFGRMKMKSLSSWNTMISMHMLNKRFDLALAQFEQMTDRDIVTWNSMISGYTQHGYNAKALNMFSNMLKDPILKPDKYTLASVLSACANLNDSNSGKQIHGYIVRTQFDLSGAVGNALISMYSKFGDLKTAQNIVQQNQISNVNVIAFTSLLDGYLKQGDMNSARRIFDSLKDRDVVVWTAMIVGYTQNGFNNEAIKLFRSMINEGPEPNSYTLAAMLSVSSSLASLEHGKQIHAQALKSESALSISVGNALINMYAKSGNIDNAKRVFDIIRCSKDTVTWTSMVISLAQHGQGKESLELFEKMLSFDIKPDHITYVGVISACTHMGLVEEGVRYFKLMQEKHGIEPTLSHHACMVDLYGRAGKLQEAYNVIQNMPIEPDVIVWGSLLASSIVHKNMDLAKIAAEKLLLIEPDNSGAYSTLANLYSACGNWDDAADVRKLMKAKQVKKDQGLSWVQIRNRVHVFGAEDSVHPERGEIYQNMAELWKEIKKLGFVPKTEVVLHDLDEEVKEEILKHHSEKLAIVYGLMKTPRNSTLRIMKNLRVCKDCHSAIKFISKLVGREIVVRDATRFHHFKNGECSCRDYW